MSDLYDNLPDRQPTMRIWQAVIAKDVIDFGDRCSIIIQALSSDSVITGCFWQSRDDVNTPHRGDLALAILDSNLEWWVIAWWPFQT